MKEKLEIGNIVLILFGIFIPLQYYIHIYKSIDISVAVILGYLFVLINIRTIVSKKTIQYILTNKGLLFYILLCLLFLIKIRYGEGLKDGIKINGYLWLGPLLYLGLRNVDIRVQKIFILSIIIFSIPIMLLAILQAGNQELKFRILCSPIMKYFIEPNTLSELLNNTFRINILANGRGGGFFVNVNKAVLYFNLIFSVLIYFLFKEKNKWFFIFIVMMVALSLVAIRSTLSFSGAIVLLMIILSSFLIAIRKKSKVASYGIISIVAIALLFPVFLKRSQEKTESYFGNNFLSIMEGKGTNIRKRIMEKNEKEFKHDNRKIIWAISFAAFKERWLFGYGFSSEEWSNVFLKHANEYGLRNFMSPHNIFLDIGRYVGIFGIIFQFLFIVFYLCKFKYIYKGKLRDIYPVVLCLMIIIVFFLHSMVDGTNPLMNPRIGMIFWSLLEFADKEAEKTEVRG